MSCIHVRQESRWKYLFVWLARKILAGHILFALCFIFVVALWILADKRRYCNKVSGRTSSGTVEKWVCASTSWWLCFRWCTRMCYSERRQNYWGKWQFYQWLSQFQACNFPKAFVWHFYFFLQTTANCMVGPSICIKTQLMWPPKVVCKYPTHGTRQKQ